MTATVSGHPLPWTTPNRLRAVGRVTARDGPSVDSLLSRKVACREAPLNHSGDKRLLGQAGDGVDPRGAVSAVPTAQADRECCHAHAGMGAWMGQDLGGVHACLTTAGVARRDEHPRAVGVVPSRILVKILQGRNAPISDLGAHVAAELAALAVADEGASIAAVEGIDSRGQADHARPGVRRVPRQLELHGLRWPEAVE